MDSLRSTADFRRQRDLFVQSIQRDINCLTDQDRRTRFRALEKLSRRLTFDRGSAASEPLPELVTVVWVEVVLPAVVRVIGDEVEKCRELAIRVIVDVSKCLSQVDATLAAIAPKIQTRIGCVPTIEPSEELRLQMVTLLGDELLRKCSPGPIAEVAESIIKVLCQSLADPFHEIRKATCRAVAVLAQRAPTVAKNGAGTLLKALLPSTRHQHSRVRLASLQAIDAVVRCGLPAGMVDETLAPGVRHLALDKAANVRECLFVSVARWLGFDAEQSQTDECSAQLAGPVLEAGRPTTNTENPEEEEEQTMDAEYDYEDDTWGTRAKSTSPAVDMTATDSLQADVAPTAYIPHLSPLLLLGITDEDPEIRVTTLALLQGVGDVYMSSRESPKGDQKTEDDSIACANAMETSTMSGAEEVGTMSGAEVGTMCGAEVGTRCGTEVGTRCGAEVGTRRGTEVENSTKGSREANGCHDMEEVVQKDEDAVECHATLPEPFTGRQLSKGCRKVVQDFLQPLLEPALKDMKEWLLPSRIAGARLLSTVLALAESHATEHLDILLPALCSATGDDDVVVAQRVVSCLHILGQVCDVSSWLPLLIDLILASRNSPPQRVNALVALGCLLKVTTPSRMPPSAIRDLCAVLASEEVRCSDYPPVRVQMVVVIHNLIRVGQKRCEDVALQLLTCLLQVQAVDDDVAVQKGVNTAISKLAAELDLGSASELYAQHISSLIQMAVEGNLEWTGSSYGKALFVNILKGAGAAVGSHLEALMGVFSSCLRPQRDPSLRISLLQVLDELLESPDLRSAWEPLAFRVITELLLPCGIWQVGKVAAAIRHATMVALGTVLRRGLCQVDDLVGAFRCGQLLPVVKSCLDEDYYADTRRAACHVMKNILRIAGDVLNDEERREIYPQLLKRMDDNNDKIRLDNTQSVRVFFEKMPSSYDDTNARYFLEALIIHMDDAEKEIQEAVCSAVEIAARKKPAMVTELVRLARSNHRSPFYCDRILAITGALEQQGCS
ncbi:hypothetical protein CBR_g30611 [Chara braunii]|uniref:TOG domain-containing protein n=1 Tax=Chara braunii TaxID=69332 RepID=A0A388LD71_CHABU|nr:hypothetical protein CBR_g30611 [Chara braunii]|eukprot:GBG80246.1 hypothetical protein CBR_g30611 [Chara braunii]